MGTFSVPRSAARFRIRPQAVAFAGSCNGSVARATAVRLVEGFARLGFGFLNGCAAGIDGCFRSAFASRFEFAERAVVACAFADRALTGSRSVRCSPVWSCRRDLVHHARRDTMSRRAWCRRLYPCSTLSVSYTVPP